MKAEHRKELETNTLADKMGHMMKRVQGSPRRAFFIYLILAVVITGVLWFVYRSWILNRQNRSEQWAQLYDGSPSFLTNLKKDGESPVGKAARLQYNWYLYWDIGLKMIGNNPRGAMQTINLVSKEYQDLAKDCKDDPVYEPEVLLGLAVTEETKAIQDRTHLDRALEYYQDVVKKYEKSAQAKFAQGRIDQLTNKRAEVASLYSDLQRAFDIQAGPAPHPFLPPQKDKAPPAP